LADGIKYTREDLQIQEEIIEGLKEIQRLQSLGKTLDEEQKALLAAALREHGNIKAAISDQRSITQDMIRQRRNSKAALFEELEVLKQQLVAYQNINTSGRYKQEVLDAQLAVEQKQLQILLETKSVTDEEVLKQKEKVDQLRKQNEAYKEQLTVAKEIGKTLGTVFAVYEKNKFFNVENAEKLTKAFKGGRIALQGMAKALGAAAVRSYLDSVVGLVFALEEAEANFIKTTGSSREFAKSIRGQYEDLRQLGVQISEVSDANAALYTTFTDFTTLSPETRDEIGKIGALLGRRGVDFKDFAAGVQASNKAFGQTGPQAAQTAMQLEALASKLQIPPQMMAKEFQASSGALAKLGKDGPMAFARLAFAFKKTGLEINKIIKISEAFDTFDGAATQAGKLNAALGGNFVNAMDLMMATDPVERFEMIRDSLSAAGLEYDTMGYYQRKFIAESVGLDSPNELAMLMSGNLEGLADSAQLSQAEIVELEKKAAEATKVQEKFNGAMRSLIVVLEPAIDLLQKFGDFLATNKGFATGLGYVIMALVGAFVLYKATMMGLFVIESLRAIGLLGLAGAEKTKNEVTKESILLSDATAVSLAKLTPLMFAFGAAVLLIGLGVAAGAIGLGFMAQSFGGLGDAAWPAAAAIIGFTLAFTLMIFVLAKTAPVAAVAGSALLYLGGGIALIGAGMLMTAKSFAMFNETLQSMDTTNMTNLLTEFDKFSNTVENMSKIADAIEEIGEAMEDLNTNKTIALTRLIKTVQIGTPEVMETAGNLEAITTNRAAAQAAIDTEAVAEIASAAAVAAVATGAQRPEMNAGQYRSAQKRMATKIVIDNVVHMDGREIGRVTDKSLGEKIAAAINGLASPIA